LCPRVFTVDPMRFVFTDEGGISRTEPFVVVTGIFVGADDQLVRLENELERLKAKYIPTGDRRDFVFHATEIWSGTRFFRDRKRWPLEKRLEILHKLARLPRKLNIPIVYEAVERAQFDLSEVAEREGRDPTPSEHSIAAHAVAFCACTLRIEQLMRLKWRNEVAQLVAEDNDQVRALVKGAHENFRDPSKADGKIIPNTVLPFRKIRGSVHFTSKAESPPLQLADVCAFIIRGHLARHPHNKAFYDRLKPMMLILPLDETPPAMKFLASPPYVSS